jgi:zinc and cadmium transporter
MRQGLDLIGPLFASAVVAAASLSARLVVWLPPRYLRACIPWLQATAVGLLLGDALLHMLPEAMAHGLSASQIGQRIALGIVCLLSIECMVRAWSVSSATAVFARMDIVGDTFHHFVDGIVIGASFAIDRTLGFIVALAIMAHELPREMGNAGVLVAGGYMPRRAFLLSVVTTAAVPLGALVIPLIGQSPSFLGSSLAVAAGTTIYLACGDVLPGIWQNLSRQHRFTPALGVAIGVAFMWLAAALGQGQW